MNCQHCHKKAILHITEVVTDDEYEELHLCDDCAQKYLYDGPSTTTPTGEAAEDSEEAKAINEKTCEVCGLKFAEFRNSGRLGCPHDFEAFEDEISPLLESIHGARSHSGKAPKRMPEARQAQQQLTQLRKKLQTAVVREDYEEAAKIRDRIRDLEQAS